MTIEADFVTIDPVSEKFIFDDGLELPFTLLDSFYAEESEAVPKEILFEYVFTIKSIFEESRAKYRDRLLKNRNTHSATDHGISL